MTETIKEQTTPGQSGKAEFKAARSARLSAALRENLKRRKAQARGRADRAPPDDDKRESEHPYDSDAPDFRRNPGRD